MGIGGSIFLIALGAIFAFAVEFNLGWLDIEVVGWVLMLAGGFGLILTLWIWNSRRRTVVQRPTTIIQDGPATERVEEEHRVVRRNPYE